MWDLAQNLFSCGLLIGMVIVFGALTFLPPLAEQ